MENKTTTSLSFKNNYNLFNNYPEAKTQLILEKIKLEEKPEYKKFLQTYFNDPSKYFLRNFNDNPIVVGKKYNKNKSFKIQIEARNSPKRKMKKNNFLLKSDPKSKSSSDQSSSDQNKDKGFTQKESSINTNNLKSGQRYINDLELNEIFSNFKNAQKANKNKIYNFITINDIRKFRAENLENSKSIKGRMLMRKKTIKLMKRLNTMDKNNAINNTNINKNNKITLTDNNDNNSNNSIVKKGKYRNSNSIDTSKKIEQMKNSSDSFPFMNKNKNIYNLLTVYQNNRYNLMDRNSTNSNDSNTPKSNYYLSKNSDSSDYKKKAINYNYNFEKLYSTLNENNQIDIFKKQTQYLTSEKYKVFKKELAKKLVSQEKIFINNNNSENKAKKISSYMSNKLKIPKEDLLMNKTEYYRIKSDLKSRLSKQMEYEYIEAFYEWEKNLKNFDIKIKYDEIIRNPKYKKYPKRRFYTMNNEYLTKRIPIKDLKKFVTNIDNIKNNFNDLYIKGKNLLELEQELAKGIKGKKILNNFEEILPYSSLKEEVYAKHFQL